MIFVDEDVNVTDARKAPRLQNLCGANAMISAKLYPPVNEAMLTKHIREGAILYRVVTHQDLRNTESDALLFGLHKMIQMGAKTHQCVLLVDSSHGIPDYDSIVKKVDEWVDFGGTSMSTYGYRASYYLNMRDQSFAEREERRKSVLMPLFGPRLELEVPTDWTITLATFPMLGYKGAKVVRKLIVDKGLGDDLLTALIFLTTDDDLNSDATWADVRDRARKWLGLPPQFKLDIDINTDYLKELKD